MLSNSNNAYPIITNLGNNANGHTISAKFNNQPSRPSHFGVLSRKHHQTEQPDRPKRYGTLIGDLILIDFVHSLIQTIIKLGHVYVCEDYISAKF